MLVTWYSQLSRSSSPTNANGISFCPSQPRMARCCLCDAKWETRSLPTSPSRTCRFKVCRLILGLGWSNGVEPLIHCRLPAGRASGITTPTPTPLAPKSTHVQHVASQIQLQFDCCHVSGNLLLLRSETNWKWCQFGFHHYVHKLACVLISLLSLVQGWANLLIGGATIGSKMWQRGQSRSRWMECLREPPS